VQHSLIDSLRVFTENGQGIVEYVERFAKLRTERETTKRPSPKHEIPEFRLYRNFGDRAIRKLPFPSIFVQESTIDSSLVGLLRERQLLCNFHVDHIRDLHIPTAVSLTSHGCYKAAGTVAAFANDCRRAGKPFLLCANADGSHALLDLPGLNGGTLLSY
jgi:hypothetical protein